MPYAVVQVSNRKSIGISDKISSMHFNFYLGCDCRLPMTVQHLLVKYGYAYGGENLFLKSLYHRWVLRSSQTPLKRNFLLEDPLAESVLRSLTPEESSFELKALLAKDWDSDKKPVLIPTPETFARDIPDFTIGLVTSVKSIFSMIHLDIGIYLLYKGQLHDAIEHFVHQELPLKDFPYLRMTKEKLDGYLNAVGLLVPVRCEDHLDLGDCQMVQIAKQVRKGNFSKLKGMLDLDLEGAVEDDSTDKILDPEFMDEDKGSSLLHCSSFTLKTAALFPCFLSLLFTFNHNHSCLL